jgi:pyrroloquinoline quinone biosynthesis protein B
MVMDVNLKVLGSGQDGGVPHPGCACRNCERARANGAYRRLAPSTAVYSKRAGFCYLIDASPDLGSQIEAVRRAVPRVSRAGRVPVSGILLTHAHIGHYTGLLLMGTEVLGETGMPVYCTAAMMEFLSTAPPFSLLVEGGNIVLHEVRPNEDLALDGVRFTPIAVPHRGRIADTVGYVVRARRRATYIPDTDRWTRSLIETVSRSDVALVDGTFYSKDELQRFCEVPHPPIGESIRDLADLGTEILFTHINHTNPVNAEGPEREDLEGKGFKLAYDGLTLRI